MICKKHNKEYNMFFSACPECIEEGRQLSTEEIEYILTFLEDSQRYCENDDDHNFDEVVKKKLEQMKLLATNR